jgi:ribonuclease-3
VLSAEGAPHDRTFTCAATVDGDQVGVGEGRSKKAAEQAAAQEVLAKLGIS